jgi:hypothetical protein
MGNILYASRNLRLFIVLIFGLSTCEVAFAQAVSQISGTTRDSSGAVVPGVSITATQADTGIKRTAVTDETGSYVLPNLPIGPYRIEAAKTGFRTYVQTGIELQVDSNPVIPVVLGVGNVSETIQVEANASQVETQKLGVGTFMETERILELPLNGRTPTDLLALTPALVPAGASPSYGMNTGVLVAVAGGQSYGVYYALDGAPHLNLYDATNMPLPFPDALLEFKVDTSTQDAQTGTHSGAQVNSVTKSGTNQFHGDAFEFLRNADLNARNFFAAQRDSLKRNQFGGVVGGPIKKDKVFFFAGYQGTTIRQTPIQTLAFVPTAAMFQGDFTTFASAQCQGHQVNLAAPYVGNKVPITSLSPAAVKMASQLPQALDGCGTYYTGNVVSQYQWQIPVRVDFQLNPKHSIFGRYLATKQDQTLPYSLSPKNLLTATGNGTDDLAQSVTFGDTYLVSPTTINSFRFSFNRVGMFHNGPNFFGPSDVGINAFSYLPHTMNLTVTGGPTFGTAVGTNTWLHPTNGTINDDVNLIRGKHQISFGANISRGIIVHLANVRSIGNYAVNGQTTGLGMADFFVGDLSQLRQSAPNDLDISQWFFGAYAQDTWKVSPRFTVNVGVRWEPFFPMQSRDSRVYTFSLPRFYAGTVSNIWTNAPPGFYYPGDPGFNGRSGMDSHVANFEPRLGLAWDPTGSGRMSIRVGAGIAYDFVNQQFYHNEDNVAPFSGDTTVNGPIPLDNPWSTTPGGNPFPYPSTPPNGRYTVGAVYLPVPPDLKTTKLYSWNLAVQRQITPRWFASVSYLGSHTVHLWDNIELNPPLLLINVPNVGSSDPRCNTTTLAVNCVTNENVRRLLNQANPVAAKDISNLTAFDDGGTAGYNGLVLNTNWRAANGVTVISNYTWSHCIGLPSNGATTPNPGTNYVHAANRNLDIGNCASDRRHIFNLTVVARTPKFENKALRLVGTGWSLSNIFRATSGVPYSVASGLDQALNGFGAQRANQLLGTTAAANQGAPCANRAPCVTWLNPAAFAQPALGTYGNLGVFNLVGPGFVQYDVALVREFQIREFGRLQFRADGFNVLNKTRFNNPGATLSSPSTFGQITSAQDPRIMQVALKFMF